MSGPAVPASRAAARFPAIRLYNHVLPVLIVAAVIAATACGFISVAPNRLVSGEPVALWLAADPRVTAALAVLAPRCSPPPSRRQTVQHILPRQASR